MDGYREKLITDIKMLVDEIYSIRTLRIIRGMLENIIKKSSY